MAEVSNSVVNYQAYNVVEGESLKNQVSRIIGIMLPRGFAAAGFSDRGDLLMIRYSDYPKDLAEWVPDFFDHRFAEEPLLQAKEMVVAIYVMTEKFMLVPNNMYDANSAVSWLRKLFFIEENETIDHYNVQDEKLQYIYSWPSALKGLAARYFPNARFIPLSAYQFTQLYKIETALHCCFSESYVTATFYQNRQLKWHQVFAYINAEDIAIKIHQVAKEFNCSVEDISMFYANTHTKLNQLAYQVSQYIPNVQPVEAGIMITNQEWSATVSLFQRLYLCAL